jgi:hypothetical protein
MSFVFIEKGVNNFKISYSTQLIVEPQSRLYNVSAETCSEMCIFEDSYLCRSFDYFVDKNTCFLYKENVKDKIYINLKIENNPNCNHYSSKYDNYFTPCDSMSFIDIK